MISLPVTALKSLIIGHCWICNVNNCCTYEYEHVSNYFCHLAIKSNMLAAGPSISQKYGYVITLF